MLQKFEWRYSHFVRLVLSYSLLAVLLIGAAGSYLYNRANAVMFEEMSRESQQSLRNIKEYLEQSLLRKYEDTFVTKVMATVNPASSDDLMALLDSSPAESMYKIRNLINDMGVIAAANEGLAGINVYMKKDDYVMNENYYYHSAANAPDSEFIEMLDKASIYQWNKRTDDTGEQVLTYIYTLPYKAIQQYAQGYLYIDINMGFLKDALNRMTNSSQETLLIFDKDNSLIFENQPVSTDILPIVNKNIGTAGSEFSVVKDQTGRNLIAFMPDTASSNGWNYVLVKPMNSFFLTTDNFKNDIIWSCVIILIAGLLSTYVLSSRIYLPLKRLVLRISEHYDNSGQLQRDHEYSVIDKFIQYTGKKLIRLQDQVRSQNLLHLIHGNINAIDDLTAVPIHSRYVPVHLRNEAGDFNQTDIVWEKLPIEIPFDFVCLNSQEAVLLFYPDPAIEESDRVIFEQLNEQLCTYATQQGLVIGVGEAVASIEDIHTAHEHAVYACSYSFLYGLPAIIRFEEIRHRRPQHISFHYEAYFNGLLAGDIQRTESIIDNYAAALTEPNLMLESLEVNIMQFVTSLYGFIIDQDLQQLFPGTTLFVEAKKKTLNSTIEWIRETSRQIAEYYAQRTSSGHHLLINELKNYIDTHPEEDISLDSLAEKARLTPNYVSALFRETLHMSVVEYVTKVRLEKAVGLLVETNAAVSEIAVRTGYRNSQYFCRKFKEKHGITPLQYRQAYSSGGNSAREPEAMK